MVTKTLLCPRCQSKDLIRYGRAPNGKQRFRCHPCAHTFRENPGERGYSAARKREILAAYQERTSLRGLTRIFGVSRTTVSTWLKEQAETLPPSGRDAPVGRGRRGSRTG